MTLVGIPLFLNAVQIDDEGSTSVVSGYRGKGWDGGADAEWDSVRRVGSVAW